MVHIEDIKVLKKAFNHVDEKLCCWYLQAAIDSIRQMTEMA